MEVKILVAGFGGQGIISLGRILAQAALLEDRQVSGIPSYGAEIRGGTAHCFIKISDSLIASPFINCPDIAIIFNQPSLDKFKKNLKKSSLIILNSDFIFNQPGSLKNKITSLPLSKMAIGCGEVRIANTIALGVMSALRPDIFRLDTIAKALEDVFKAKGSLEVNLKAFRLGHKFKKIDLPR